MPASTNEYFQSSSSPAIVCFSKSDLQERLRSYNKELIEMARRLVSVPRMVEALLQGLSSKSMRTKVDCIEIMDHMIEEEGLPAVNQTRQKPVAAIAQVQNCNQPQGLLFWECRRYRDSQIANCTPLFSMAVDDLETWCLDELYAPQF